MFGLFEVNGKQEKTREIVFSKGSRSKNEDSELWREEEEKWKIGNVSSHLENLVKRSCAERRFSKRNVSKERRSSFFHGQVVPTKKPE